MTDTLAASLAPAQPQPRPDPYRLVHKGLRRALFRAIERAGATRWDDAVERDAAREEIGRVLAIHHRHAVQEERFAAPLLRAADPALAAEIEREHADTLASIDALRAGLDAARDAAGGRALHDALCAWALGSLEHMADEETRVLAALRAAHDDEAIAAAGRGMVGTLEDDALLAFLVDVLPAASAPERAALLDQLRRSRDAALVERAAALSP